jgi:hypothetical protein
MRKSKNPSPQLSPQRFGTTGLFYADITRFIVLALMVFFIGVFHEVTTILSQRHILFVLLQTVFPTAFPLPTSGSDTTDKGLVIRFRAKNTDENDKEAVLNGELADEIGEDAPFN